LESPYLPENLLPANWFVEKETDTFLIAYKPPHLPTVPNRSSPSSLLTQLKKTGYLSLRTITRLDQEVSGWVLFAKGKEPQRDLTNLLPSMEKRYLALTLFPPNPEEGEVDLPIGEGRKGKMRVGKGKPSLTFYRTVREIPPHLAWVEVLPKTGRRHQIRLHLGAIGAPIVGDRTYLPYFLKQIGKPISLDPHLPLLHLFCTELALMSPEYSFRVIWEELTLWVKEEGLPRKK
jgi:23S rRNA-/tRNA-specific pseudouridylate synthase